MILRVKRPFLTQLLAHLQSVYPQEGCGILAGTAGEVTQLYPIENRLHSRTVYEMSPQQQLTALLEIEEKGWELLAIYHSHPQGPETPSLTDVRQAYYPQALYVIVSLAQHDQPGARAFRIVNGRVSEATIVVQP